MAQVSEETRRQMIAEAAYFRARQRGFGGGDPVSDWLEAEDEVDAELSRNGSGEFPGGLEERLAVANEWLKVMRKKLGGLTSEAREEWETDIAKLARLRDRLRIRAREIRERSDQAAERAKGQAEKVWDEISDILERVSARKSNNS